MIFSKGDSRFHKSPTRSQQAKAAKGRDHCSLNHRKTQRIRCSRSPFLMRARQNPTQRTKITRRNSML